MSFYSKVCCLNDMSQQHLLSQVSREKEGAGVKCGDSAGLIGKPQLYLDSPMFRGSFVHFGDAEEQIDANKPFEIRTNWKQKAEE